MINIVIISHALVAGRQQKFAKALSKYCNVLAIAPAEWGSLFCQNQKEENYELYADSKITGTNMYNFMFSEEAFEKVKAFKPNIIYNQEEVYCLNSIITQQLARNIGCKFVNFLWDNINEPSLDDKYFIDRCDLIIAGNKEAKELYNGDCILPQTGIDTEEFNLCPIKENNIVFAGRLTPEKGINYLKEAYPETLFVSGRPYKEVAEILSKTKISVCYSYDLPGWKEQFLNYSVAESLASGCCSIISDTSAMKEWAEGSPCIIVPMHRPDLLKEEINKLLLDEPRRLELSQLGREWVKKFDNDIIAKQLYEIFEKLVIKNEEKTL